MDLPGCPPAPGAIDISLDLADPDATLHAVDAFAEEQERLDFVVHCAGITADSVVWKMPVEEWRRVLSVNLDSAFFLLQAAVPHLRKTGGGSVVLISSINGERGKFGQSNYAASKAGLNALARSTAKELGRFGVRVNAVAPGLVRTAMTESLPGEVLRTALDETALGRMAEPEDVAGSVLFLCSDLARHVTGQVLRVDGGQLTA
jgi:acetoacetyl-CoA reductase/3-oxoacyl-[acyl-carrier protein] reductase